MVLSPEHLVWFQGKQFSGLERRQSDHLEGKAWLGTSDSGAQVLVMLLDCLGDAGQDLPLSLSLSSPKIERSLEISTSPNMSTRSVVAYCYVLRSSRYFLTWMQGDTFEKKE